MISSQLSHQNVIPEEFLQRLRQIVPAADLDEVLHTFTVEKPVSFRINTLHDAAAVREELRRRNIAVEEVPWCGEALVLADRHQAADLEPLSADGKIYRQGLSSILASLILAPAPGDAVLDACAAPGSKTSHCAALMDNAGRIVAVERVRARLYKLRAVLEQLGVRNTETILADVRRYRPTGGLFDKVLVDAPCSSEGRFQTFNPRSVNYWSLRKVREMRRKQRGILLSTARLLKTGGILVYSTCTFAPEENEGVVDWFQRKTGAAFRLLDLPAQWQARVACYPAVAVWGKTVFSEDMKRCLRVKPTQRQDGFFIACWRKEEAS